MPNYCHNTLIIEDTSLLGITSVNTFTLNTDKYNTYNYGVDGANLSTDLLEILNTEERLNKIYGYLVSEIDSFPASWQGSFA